MIFRYTRLLVLILAGSLIGCAPPPDLTDEEEELVRRCLELAFKQESDAECAQRVTRPMERAFLEEHPDFYEQLIAERKAFVEERIAEDQRRRDDLNLCLDAHEAGRAHPPACEEFMAHEITRGLEDRRLRRCARATLDGDADARRHCEGMSESDIEDEVQMEWVRRGGR